MDASTETPYVEPTCRRRNQDYIYHFDLGEVGVLVELRKVAVRNGDYKGLFWVRTYDPKTGEVDAHIHLQNTNLTSGQTKAALVNTLRKKEHGLIDWERVVEYVHTRTFQLVEEGEPPVDLRDVIVREEDKLDLVEGVLPLYQPATIFADGGTGKSVIALAMGAAVASGRPVGPFKPLRMGRVLYLDWETVQQEQALRFNAIFAGLGLPPDEWPPVHYLCMKVPLVDAMEHIERAVANLGIDFVIVDSIAPALGGPVDAEYVNPMFDALRTLENVTVLILSHIAKADRSKGEKAEAFGSIYVHNRSRAMHALESVQSNDPDAYKLVLTNRKRNRGRKGGRLAMVVRWHGDLCTIERGDMRGDRDLVGSLPFPEQVLTMLQRGALTIKEIAERTQKSETLIREALNRLGPRVIPIGQSVGEDGGRPATRYGVAAAGTQPRLIHDVGAALVRQARSDLTATAALEVAESIARERMNGHPVPAGEEAF